jgi:RimJ/RimL family protein N-acetyltransferase
VDPLQYTVETERLTLHPLSEADAETWLRLMADPVAKRLLHSPEPVADRERALGGLRSWVAHFEDGVGMYAVRVRETGEEAGFVGFVPRELDWGREVELGWLLLPEFWGRGYATEAARALLPLGPSRIVSMIRVENDASENVARKLGMHVDRAVEYHGFETHVWATRPA